MTFFSFGDTCLDKKGVAPCTPVKVNILEKMSKYETLPIFYIKKVLPITTFFQMFSSCTNNGILLAITIAIAELLLYFSIQYPHHKVENLHPLKQRLGAKYIVYNRPCVALAFNRDIF